MQKYLVSLSVNLIKFSQVQKCDDDFEDKKRDGKDVTSSSLSFTSSKDILLTPKLSVMDKGSYLKKHDVPECDVEQCKM